MRPEPKPKRTREHEHPISERSGPERHVVGAIGAALLNAITLGLLTTDEEPSAS